MATAAEISEYDTEELERQLSETRRELFNLRFQLATGQLDNFSRINHVRKDVARMMTELRIREIGEAEGLSLAELPGHRAAARRRDGGRGAGSGQDAPRPSAGPRPGPRPKRRRGRTSRHRRARRTTRSPAWTRTSGPKRWPTTTAWPAPTTRSTRSTTVDDADDAEEKS